MLCCAAVLAQRRWLPQSKQWENFTQLPLLRECLLLYNFPKSAKTACKARLITPT